MPRNYDEMRAQRDLEFVICGEHFTMRLVPWSKIKAWEEREDEAKIESTADVARLANDRILEVIDDSNGAADRWRALQEREDGPTLGELADLMRWVIEVQSGLPTEAPSPSAAGRGRTVASSKGASS